MGTLPVEGREEVKRTNEIKMAIPLLEAIEIAGKDITADALLTQRKLAEYLVEKRQAAGLDEIQARLEILLDAVVGVRDLRGVTELRIG